MTTKEQLLALAERVEQATEGSLDLDKAILAALGYTWRGMAYWYRDDSHTWRGPSCFTQSLDAAISLLPEGWKVSGLFQRNCKLPNWIWKAELWSPEADENVRGIARNADVPALAIAAAALRARAHSQEVK